MSAAWMPLRERGGRGGVSVARALGSSTRAGIFAHLQKVEEPCTVRDIAGVFELHPNVARTHLELLADAGLVSVGRRKHPGGGRPAKVYTAREGAPAVGDEDGLPDSPAAARLLVRLLVALAEERQAPVPSGRTGNAALNVRAHELAVVEGRKLAGDAGARGEDGGGLRAAAERAVGALRLLAVDVRVARSGEDWVDVAGLREIFPLLEETRPALADHLVRGLLTGALGAAGVAASVADGGEDAATGRLVRARAVSSAANRGGPRPANTIDARGGQREAGVVRAMRALTGLQPGDVLEVLAEGPGSPAAFARWADRAGHQLLAVERATDAAGRPAIRLLIRKGT
jgi:TusA-related sulfurtransferase/DNA-binding transcriptional ArsR family regulator